MKTDAVPRLKKTGAHEAAATYDLLVKIKITIDEPHPIIN